MNWMDVNREFYYSVVWKTVLDEQGRRILKFPTDLWVYRELIGKIKPEVIVETGAAEGGSAAFFADFAPVISVDLHLPEKPDGRVIFIIGDSVDPVIAEQVKVCVDGRPCLVSLDSDHNAAHVRAEIDLYAPLVPIGGYLVVEDTAVDAYGIEAHTYPEGGPAEPAKELAATGRFRADPECERFFIGMNPGGWLRRVA
jgi:cephalosporin hydroxylase